MVKIWWDKCIDRDLERQKKEHEEKGPGENANLIVRSEVSIIDFAMIMIDNQVVQDRTTAVKYLQDTVGYKIEHFSYNEFLSIFVKVILKDIVCGIAQTVQNFKRKDEIQNLKNGIPIVKDKELLWKLSDYRRENLLNLLEKGMVKYQEDI